MFVPKLNQVFLLPPPNQTQAEGKMKSNHWFFKGEEHYFTCKQLLVIVWKEIH